MLRRDDDDCRRVADRLDRNGSIFTTDITALEDRVDLPSSTAANRRFGRQGFQRSTAARMAVESRAMEVATALLAAQGWAVEGVSATRSYDLHCTRGGTTRFVEVKGTAGPGDEIQITAAEVSFANVNRGQMVLIVVTGIGLERNGEQVEASGGAAHVLEGWAPEPGDLSPISYYCRLSLTV